MKKFVFVVTGGKEHIEELNFSLQFIRNFSKNEIIVLTDIQRNEIPILHDKIIDIRTPIEYNNHQASIYIKTGINKFLEKGHTYCYLDGDIVAINSNIDKIFSHYSSPISFASDHCKINEFSPHAMNCNCVEGNAKEEGIFNMKLSETFGKINLTDPIIKKQSEELREQFKKYKAKPFLNLLNNIRYLLLRYVLPVNEFNLTAFRFNKSNKCWYNSENQIILFDYPYYEKQLWGTSGIRFNKECNFWETKEGKKFEFKAPKCNHLTEYLFKEYNVNIPFNWQHWNGGVFLFDDSSEDFLNYWHDKTIKEFSNDYTKTRDQGTLALTVWKFGLQNHPNIPKEYNWITEYANNDIQWDKSKGYTFDGFRSEFKPNFMHIYHEWGNKDWSIWDSVIQLQEKLDQ
ncbi:MAG: hypothetical protein C0596_12815 [Marinilabiliales bacterium]|nr:MAG: hypothetical protein C0596_12815 [Marinilabiliales bacterium]